MHFIEIDLIIQWRLKFVIKISARFVKMSALKRYIDGKENSIEEEELIVQNLKKKVNFVNNSYVTLV